MEYITPLSRVRDIRMEVSFLASQLTDFPEEDLFIEGDGNNN
jgi:hypothetical protein